MSQGYPVHLLPLFLLLLLLLSLLFVIISSFCSFYYYLFLFEIRPVVPGENMQNTLLYFF